MWILGYKTGRQSVAEAWGNRDPAKMSAVAHFRQDEGLLAVDGPTVLALTCLFVSCPLLVFHAAPICLCIDPTKSQSQYKLYLIIECAIVQWWRTLSRFEPLNSKIRKESFFIYLNLQYHNKVEIDNKIMMLRIKLKCWKKKSKG